MNNELERTNEVEITCTRDIEDITAEILEAKRAGGEAILTIGRGLIEAKALLAHGEWLPWLTERVEFSERSAQNFMRLAREWSNPQTLADLGASKALALLALPAEERADFIASVHVVDGAEKTTEELSSRELAQAIRERDEARREAEAARADAGTANAMIPEQKDYFPAVEEFLRSLASMNVRGLAMVALVKDGGVHDVVTAWECGPFELAETAAVLQLRAAELYTKINGTENDNDEEDAL